MFRLRLVSLALAWLVVFGVLVHVQRILPSLLSESMAFIFHHQGDSKTLKLLN